MNQLIIYSCYFRLLLGTADTRWHLSRNVRKRRELFDVDARPHHREHVFFPLLGTFAANLAHRPENRIGLAFCTCGPTFSTPVPWDWPPAFRCSPRAFAAGFSFLRKAPGQGKRPSFRRAARLTNYLWKSYQGTSRPLKSFTSSPRQPSPSWAYSLPLLLVEV